MTRPLSVAVLAACPFPSHQGTQVFIRHLVQAKQRAGMDVELISYGYGTSLDDMGFVHHRAKSIHGGFRSGPNLRRLLNDCALAAKTKQVLSDKKFHVLHVHNVEGLLIGAALKAAGEKTPLVYHAHNTMAEELPTYFESRAMGRAAKLAGEAYDRLLPRQANAVIVFDEAHQAEQISLGVRPERVFVVPPALHADEMRRQPYSKPNLPKGRYLLYAGNPDGYQNLALLFKAVNKVFSRLPDVRLLGLSNAALAEFGAEAGRLSAQGKFILRSYKTPHELVNYMRQAQVGLSTRVLKAGFPVKLINYLQVGLQSVACATPGLPERHPAIHLSRPNPESFANAIVHALNQEKTIPNLRQEFEIDRTVGAYAEIYRRVL